MKIRSTLFLLLVTLVACQKEPILENEPAAGSVAPVSSWFDFKTTRSIKIQVRLLSNTGGPMKGVPVRFLTTDNRRQVFVAASDANGFVDAEIPLPRYVGELMVIASSAGLPSDVTAFISGDRLDLVLGGPAGVSGNVVQAASTKAAGDVGTTVKDIVYNPMGSSDSQGKPLYLQNERTSLSAPFLEQISSSLPSSIDLRTVHPQFLSPGIPGDLRVTQDGELMVTFVSESSESLNTLAYYTYPTATPPATRADIRQINYIFPNCSAVGSSGGLIAGDRVKIGPFKAGTSVGFVLLKSAWNGSSKTVNPTSSSFFSDERLNPEPAAQRKHSVMLNSPADQSYVIGFEEINRTQASCDHDFNDLIFQAVPVKSMPVTAEGIPALSGVVDSDGDGVNNETDEYPADPQRAWTNYYPAKGSWGTLAFEDNWPMNGDADMNDLVLSYQYRFITNARGQTVELKGDYAVNGKLAYFHNGFGLQFGAPPSAVAAVSGCKLTTGSISLNANGTEAGQSKAVVILFDNHRSLSDSLHVTIKFTSPQTSDWLNDAPFNPFLISDGRRGYEIHLPGNPPTDKAAKELFGRSDDLSDPASGKYYVGADNRPWALHFAEPFRYPKEGKPIHEAYLHYNDWVNSKGAGYRDWYHSLATGYRNDQLIEP